MIVGTLRRKIGMALCFIRQSIKLLATAGLTLCVTGAALAQVAAEIRSASGVVFAQPQGGQVTRESPIHKSKVSPVVDGKATRVRFVTKADGSKVRVAARGGKELGVIRKAPAKKK